MIRILIADDHAAVRKGLKETIEDTPGFTVVAQAGTGDQVLQKILKQRFDVIIMDISMPGRSGLETLEAIRKVCPDAAVLIYTMHSEDEFALRALKAGAAGFLTKDNPLDEVVGALKSVTAGNKYFSPSVAQQLARIVASDSGKRPHERLSNREYEIMLLIALRKSLKQAA